MSLYILFSLKFQDKTMNRNQCVCGGVTNIQMNAVHSKYTKFVWNKSLIFKQGKIYTNNILQQRYLYEICL